MLQPHPQNRFTASYDCLPAVLAYVDRRACELALPQELRLKLCLIAEELFTNTVCHGHGGGSVAPVSLELDRGAAAVELRFEDAGPAYNPFARVDRAAHERPVMDRPVGHLGLLLIDGLAAEVRYDRQGDANRLRILLHCGAQGD